jgi:hypothetical protein
MASIPVLGAVEAFLAPFLRYLKPNLEPGLGVRAGRLPPNLAEGELPRGEPLPVGRMEELREPWSSKFFVFTHPGPGEGGNGTRCGDQASDKAELPRLQTGAGADGHVIFSRICPYLGCIFN